MLAEHLEKGQLGHQIFDFGMYNDAITNTCGTTGCAIGECPIAFPQDWGFSELGTPRLNGELNIRDSAMKFFEIESGEFSHLFTPDCQSPDYFGGIHLTLDATKEQVAANLRAFVALKTASHE